MGKQTEKEETLPFDVDEALNRLEEINTRLAGENLPLQESISLYKEGVDLAELCKKHLEGVEQELQIVNPQ